MSNTNEIAELLKDLQDNLAGSRQSCFEGELWLWDRIDKALAALQAEPVEHTVREYAAAARVIALNLCEFRDDALPYPKMIIECSRRAANEIEALRAQPAKVPEGFVAVPRQDVESAINALRYGSHPHPSPHADDLEKAITAAPAAGEGENTFLEDLACVLEHHNAAIFAAPTESGKDATIGIQTIPQKWEIQTGRNHLMAYEVRLLKPAPPTEDKPR